jgi:hypothetical protein
MDFNGITGRAGNFDPGASFSCRKISQCPGAIIFLAVPLFVPDIFIPGVNAPI